MRKRNSDNTPGFLWIFVGLLGAAGLGLLSYGLFAPVGPRNLADPIPVASLQPEAHRFPAVEPSAQRKIADRRNADQIQHCDERLHDCDIACLQYPKKSAGRAECRTYCQRAKSSCLTWAHR